MAFEMGLPLRLASQSRSRAALLGRAGLVFETKPAPVDETETIRSMLAEGIAPRDIADALAELKARKGANGAPPEMLVIGADQVLACEGRILEKPATMEEARSHLRFLSGKRHELYSAVACAKAGEIVWRHVETARLTMRALSEAFLDAYLAEEGEILLGSCGAYRVEGAGLHLFTRIEGEASVIQGLPMLALLQFLRDRGAIPA